MPSFYVNSMAYTVNYLHKDDRKKQGFRVKKQVCIGQGMSEMFKGECSTLASGMCNGGFHLELAFFSAHRTYPHHLSASSTGLYFGIA